MLMTNFSLFFELKRQTLEIFPFLRGSDAQAIGFLWAIVGILFVIFELGTPGLFFFLSFAVGSFISAVLAFWEFSFVTQALSFLVNSTFVIIFMKQYFASKTQAHQSLKTNSDALINQEAVVTVAIEPHRPGRVKIKGDDWPAVVEKPVSLKEGTVVMVVRIEGNKLVVRQKGLSC